MHWTIKFRGLVGSGAPTLKRGAAKHEVDKLEFLIDDGQTLNNNAAREKLSNERAELFMVNGVFK